MAEKEATINFPLPELDCVECGKHITAVPVLDKNKNMIREDLGNGKYAYTMACPECKHLYTFNIDLNNAQKAE